MYNHMNAGFVPDFELYDRITRLAIIYETILEYSKCQLFTKYDCLHIIN